MSYAPHDEGAHTATRPPAGRWASVTCWAANVTTVCLLIAALGFTLAAIDRTIREVDGADGLLSSAMLALLGAAIAALVATVALVTAIIRRVVAGRMSQAGPIVDTVFASLFTLANLTVFASALLLWFMG